jgi:Xaa-Pro dipeptidase
MFDLSAVQSALRDFQLDGWLLYDFRGLNPLARRVLGLPEERLLSRRWFYYVPAAGEPSQLVHRIEPQALASLPGRRLLYLRWQELEAGLAQLLAGARRVAMEYVPRNANPYLSRVDAGTVELVRACGVEVVSSGDLVQRFEACWDEEQWALHQEAARHTRSAFDRAFAFIAEGLRRGIPVRESQVQQCIQEHLAAHRLIADHPPICAAGGHSSDPHYEPRPGQDALIREGDLVLIDLWGKCDRPRAVYSDLTWMAYAGREVPAHYAAVFAVVVQARDAALALVRQAFAEGRPLHGWEVDEAARAVVAAAGYGPYFCHRTGHSLGQEIHGNGANLDNLETHEERRLLPRTGFTIEPGIYLPEFGMRSEINVYIDAQGQVHVTGGPPQQEIVPLLA